MKKTAFLLVIVMLISSLLVACNEELTGEPQFSELTLNFNDSNICTSKYNSKGEGDLYTYSDWVSTNYIEIDGWYGIEYELAAHKLIQSVAFYTESKQYVSGIGSTSMLDLATTVMGFTTIPEKAKYVRFINYMGHGDMPAYIDCFVKIFKTKEDYEFAYSQSKYRELVVACLGDSLTEGDYGSNTVGVANRHYKNYPYFLAKELGCMTINYGKCGANSKSFYDNYYSKGDVDISKADFIIIMLGTNCGLDGEYGTNYRTLVTQVKNDMKQGAKLVLVTPPSATIDKSKVNQNYMPNIISAYNVVKDISKTKGTELIDAFKYSPIQPANEEKYQANDGLHMVEAGYKAFAKYMADEIVKILEKR